jgi:hypothetical protein
LSNRWCASDVGDTGTKLGPCPSTDMGSSELARAQRELPGHMSGQVPTIGAASSAVTSVVVVATAADAVDEGGGEGRPPPP